METSLYVPPSISMPMAPLVHDAHHTTPRPRNNLAVFVMVTVCLAVLFVGGAALLTVASSRQQVWSKSPTVIQGDIQVKVTGGGMANVPFLDVLGRVQFTSPYFVINPQIKNLSTTRKIDFETWRSSAVLEDNFGNTYSHIGVTPMRNPALLEPAPDLTAIYPGKTFFDSVVFERPVANAQWLHLQLPASHFGGSGYLRFEIRPPYPVAPHTAP
ncbi:MAG TPA: hypothetical protein VG167_18545 [Verrucomicrobiae bacterium]|nr:hypothetical protein [Verrucomicrobiae bacterium]